VIETALVLAALVIGHVFWNRFKNGKNLLGKDQ
jgi:hypothetical protein